ALAFVHARGICHRDLKPSNVLLGPGGEPLLLDFNLSTDRLTLEHRVGGTLPYMAPEQLRAALPDQDEAPVAIDARPDLFALRVIRYELLGGNYPFGPIPLRISTEELRSRLLERHRAGPTPLRQANPLVDRGLARLVEGCLAHDPNYRPHSAFTLAAALR